MAWQTPKTDWSAQDGVRDTDLNRIEDNLLYLYNTDGVRADKTVYVATTGNDNTGTGSASAPYATINKALNSISKTTNGRAVAVNIAAGTYAENILIKGYSGPIILTGSYNAVAIVSSFKVDGCICILDTLAITVAGKTIEVTNGATLVGTGRLNASGAATNVSVTNGSRVSLSALNSASASGYALSVDGASQAHFGTMQGNENSVGILVQGGSVVSYRTNNLDAIDTDIVSYSGGRVYSGSSSSVLAMSSVE